MYCVGVRKPELNEFAQLSHAITASVQEGLKLVKVLLLCSGTTDANTRHRLTCAGCNFYTHDELRAHKTSRNNFRDSVMSRNLLLVPSTLGLKPFLGQPLKMVEESGLGRCSV